MKSCEFSSFLIGSGEKVFPDTMPADSIFEGSCFSNEAYMLILAYKTNEQKRCIPISVSATCAEADVSVYKIGYVPVTRADIGYDEAASEERDAGLYPDIMYPRTANPVVVEYDDVYLPFCEKDEKNLLNATTAFQSLAIVINEKSAALKPGKHSLDINIFSLLDGKMLAEHKFLLNVLDEKLPETNLCYTNWFHYDCISDIHSVDLYSDKYFDILEKYILNATRNGMNMLLTPFFTPPLDTFKGGERMCTQLVKVEKNGQKFKFDFSLAERFIRIALKCGIKHIEHSHLFTQWGAEHAPNIYATEDGEYKRIFGWDTVASGEEYRNFLDAYIPELIKFADKEYIKDKLFFHISDEPTSANEHTYKKAVDAVSKLLMGYRSGDALENIIFYEKKFVKVPIVAISKADSFFGKCSEFWVYYTGGYFDGSGLEKCTNRLLTSKPYRTRILGLHMYKYRATGFLHWAYNFYYDRMSAGLANPIGDSCYYKQLPGASYLVYPTVDGVCPSLREKYMLEAINDYRALCLLEEYIGYENVIEICEEFFGCEITNNTMPNNAKQMRLFREMINNEIKIQYKRKILHENYQ